MVLLHYTAAGAVSPRPPEPGGVHTKRAAPCAPNVAWCTWPGSGPGGGACAGVGGRVVRREEVLGEAGERASGKRLHGLHGWDGRIAGRRVITGVKRLLGGSVDEEWEVFWLTGYGRG